jgi:hypothetical protein
VTEQHEAASTARPRWVVAVIPRAWSGPPSSAAEFRARSENSGHDAVPGNVELVPAPVSDRLMEEAHVAITAGI